MRRNIATAWLQKAAEESLGKSAASRLGLPVNARPFPAADAAAAAPASPTGRRCAALRICLRSGRMTVVLECRCDEALGVQIIISTPSSDLTHREHSVMQSPICAGSGWAEAYDNLGGCQLAFPSQLLPSASVRWLQAAVNPNHQLSCTLPALARLLRVYDDGSRRVARQAAEAAVVEEQGDGEGDDEDAGDEGEKKGEGKKKKKKSKKEKKRHREKGDEGEEDGAGDDDGGSSARGKKDKKKHRKH